MKYQDVMDMYRDELASYNVVDQDWVLDWYFDSPKRYLGLTGPKGSGKNYIGQLGWAIWAYETEFLNKLGEPALDGEFMILAKRLKGLRRLAKQWSILYNKLEIPGFSTMVGLFRFPNKHMGIIEASAIPYGEIGQTAKAGDVQGDNLLGVFIDEGANLNGEVRSEVFDRLGRNFLKPKVCIVSNPGQPSDEYQRNFLDMPSMDEVRDYVILPIHENPSLDVEDYTKNQIAKATSEVQIKRNLVGLPCGSQNLVIQRHMDYFIRKECEDWWPRIGGIDYGPDGCTAAVIIAFDPKNKTFHVEKEYSPNLHSDVSILPDVQAEMILDNLGDEVLFWVCDGTAELQRWLEIKSKKDVTTNVLERKESDSQLQLLFLRGFLTVGDCIETRREISEWEWKLPKPGAEPTKDNRPVRGNDHFIDAVKYAMEHGVMWLIEQNAWSNDET